MNPTDRPPDPPSDDPDRTLPYQRDDVSRREGAGREPAGASIGNYRILGKLGEGGMGVVYEAEQRHPNRRVALKVVRGGHFVDDLSVRLFEREAETLGRLKHAGIAAIYESGRTDEGRHYFAMELVRGKTLGAYIAEEDPPLSDRLALFRRICEAVNYAHQRGVIHRDLKPSNILIDEDGVPKVLDFGLARITDADTNAGSIASEVGAIKGTLPYMSPEQARGNPDDIDLRTDVYSLGVILYELLAGARPYETNRGSILESIAAILDQPPAPFASIAPAGPRPSGRSFAAKLAGGELETITRKALEKDPGARYQSAAAFSDDIERHLANQPILARPPSTIYQLKKLVARNKLPFAFAATLVLLLAGFGVWMSVLFARAEVARLESEAVTDFLSDMLAAVDPGEQGRDVTVREVLDEGAKTIDEEFGEQPLVRARLMTTMGDVYRKLAHYDSAEPLLVRALALREQAFGPDDVRVAQSLAHVGALQQDRGDLAAAESAFARSLAIREGSLGSRHPEVARALNNLATIAIDEGDFAIARDYLERSLAIKEEKLGEANPETAKQLQNLGVVCDRSGDTRAAKEYFLRVLAIREKQLGMTHPDVALTRNSLGVVCWKLGELGEAESHYRRAIDVQEANLGADHPEVGKYRINLGLLMNDKKDYAEAETQITLARGILEKALGPEHFLVATTWGSLGTVYQYAGEPEKARTHYERALELQTKSLGPDHPEVASTLYNLGDTWTALNAPGRALVCYERALPIYEKTYGADHPWVGDAVENIANASVILGDDAKALAHFERALAMRESQFGADDPGVLSCLDGLGAVLERLGREEESRAMRERAKAIRSDAG